MKPETEAVLDRFNKEMAALPDMERLMVGEQRRMEIAEQLTKDDPSLPPIAAIVMAGDMASAERSERWVAEGADAIDCVRFVGSYARFGFAVKMWQQGLIPEDWLLDELPELWRGSDPDDTDPVFLDLWVKARERWGGGPKGMRSSYVRDGAALPKGPLFVYRGQRGGADEKLGIAWTTDIKIAEKFARTGGLRGATFDGTVFKVRLPKDRVLAYLTGRGESEVIFDPTWLERGAWQPTEV